MGTGIVDRVEDFIDIENGNSLSLHVKTRNRFGREIAHHADFDEPSCSLICLIVFE